MDDTTPKNSAQSDTSQPKTEHATSEPIPEIPTVETILANVKQANSMPDGLDSSKK